MPHSEHSSPERHAVPRILFIDAYDSFSNNIVALVQDKINAHVTVIKIDDSRYLADVASFASFLQDFDAVIAGPGPGSPAVQADVGLIAELWHLQDEHVVPVLGICLGFQSLTHAFGAQIEQLHDSRHGIVAKIFHSGKSIFKGLDEIYATQYNSLHAVVGHDAQDELLVERERDLWLPSKSCPSLQPLAWVLDDMGNSPILMAVQHTSRPFWGVQFHPESICTNDEGATILAGWWAEVQRFKAVEHGRESTGLLANTGLSGTVENDSDEIQAGSENYNDSDKSSSTTSQQSGAKVLWTSLPLGKLNVAAICHVLGLGADEIALLESATNAKGEPTNVETGRFSIIGTLIPGQTTHIQYDVRNRRLFQFNGHPSAGSSSECTDVWAFLKAFVEDRQGVDGPTDSPFWGGLIGFISYEACLERVGVKPPAVPDEHADLCFAFVERSIVVDHVAKRMHLQSIRPDDVQWVTSTAEALCEAITAESKGRTVASGVEQVQPKILCQHTQDHSGLEQLKIKTQSASRYCEKVRQCQDLIRAGESYELCLTEQMEILVASRACCSAIPNRTMYAGIRTQNPAPFGAFLKLRCRHETVTVLGSSPERFLRWDRTGSCQLRPIKGTVKKEPGMTRNKAEAILQTSKERAENLMIVDLIRHDLHGVLGPDNVRVSKLMGVEEYATVYQLVSVIEGQIPATGNVSGIDVLAASLPPGSMTGAPKRRSCELLQVIEEHKPRGIYSGVLGYLDVGGGGDFSVVIRTAYKWDKNLDSEQRVGLSQSSVVNADLWHVGAGGAVTSQSTDRGEWEEMEAKRSVIVNAFKSLVGA